MAEVQQKDSRLRLFFKGVKAEFNKIKWPSRNTSIKQLIAVLAVTIVVGILIVLIDFGSQELIDFLLGL